MPAAEVHWRSPMGSRKSERRSVSVPFASDRGSLKLSQRCNFSAAIHGGLGRTELFGRWRGAAGDSRNSRQIDDKRGAFAWLAAHRDLASVVADHGLHDGQA